MTKQTQGQVKPGTPFVLAHAIADANAEQLERLGIAMRWPEPQVPVSLLKTKPEEALLPIHDDKYCLDCKNVFALCRCFNYA